MISTSITTTLPQTAATATTAAAVTTAATAAAATTMTNNNKAAVMHIGVQGTLHKRGSSQLRKGGLVLALQVAILKAQVVGWAYCTGKEN